MIKFDRKELLEHVKIMSSIVPSRTPKPILENIRFKVKGNSVKLFSTDLEVGITREFEALEGEDADFLLDANKLLNILKVSNAPVVKLELNDNNTCNISLDKDKYKLFFMSGEEFPEIGSDDGKAIFKLPSKFLLSLLNKTHFAAATEATRYTMNSVKMEINNNKMFCVATDGKRMAVVSSEVNVDSNYDFLIPTKGVALIRKSLSEFDGDIVFYKENNMMYLKYDNTVIIIRLLQGTYPPYKNVIPKGLDKSISLDKDSLKRGLKKSLILTTPESTSVMFEINSSKLLLSSHDPNMGSSNIPIKLQDGVEGDSLKISFNPHLILDSLNVIDKSLVSVKVKDSTSPMMIEEGDFLYVVMPLNI